MKAERRIVCPRDGKPADALKCLKCEDPCVPRSVLFSFLQAGWNSLNSLKIVGVTEITDCPRRAYFRRVQPYEDFTFPALVRMQLGSGFHLTSVAASNASITWVELPVLRELDGSGWFLAGILDEYDPLSMTVWERKTTSVWSYKNDKLPYPEHVRQLKLYVYMLYGTLGIVDAKLVYFFRDARRSEKQFATYEIEVPERADDVDDVLGEDWKYAVKFALQLEAALAKQDPSLLPRTDQEFKCNDCPFKQLCDAADRRAESEVLDKFMGDEASD